MNILVIGGAGYIGSVTSELLINKKHNVIIVDDLSTSSKKLIDPRASFFKGSILDEKFLNSVFEKNKIDVVIFLAAKVIVSESMKRPQEYLNTNVGGLKTVLKCMKNFKVNRIIFSSSAAVYGNPIKIPINESDRTKPINPYGKSKLMSENLLIRANKTFGLKYVILRFFNVAGASDSLKYGLNKKNSTFLIPNINNSIIQNKPFEIYGDNYKTKDGTCLRDYVHVQDLAEVFLKTLTYVEKKSNIFNIGSNKGYTVKEVVDKSFEVLNKQVKLVIKTRRLGDPDQLLTDNSLAWKEMKWKPKKSLKDMIVSDYKFRKLLK